MAELLNMVFPDDIVQRIAEFNAEPRFEWQVVYGSTRIYQTNHILTYGGGSEGGYVYFYREREPGWYAWERNWGEPPSYTKIYAMLVMRFEDDVEQLAVVPLDFELTEEENEDITILDSDLMESQDTA